jgi:predicted transcriptional regulator
VKLPGGHLGDRVPVRGRGRAGGRLRDRAARADENGEPLYVVQLIAMTDGAAEIVAVKVPGQPGSGIRQGHPVRVHGLVAQAWTMGDRSGVAFRAAKVEPAVPAAKAS